LSGHYTAAIRAILSSQSILEIKKSHTRYKKCETSKNLRSLLEQELTTAGLRRAQIMANNLATIWENLTGGEWENLLFHLNTLTAHTTSQKEKAVVKYLLGGNYPGLGQKQSRNFIQWIGLSRYEIPLDSRVLKKMREFGANFVPAGTALTDEVVYLFVQDGLQKVAHEIGIYPCMLDACIFVSFDASDEMEDA
jgi:uncharacterized protein YjiS (DUF1127 family)